MYCQNTDAWVLHLHVLGVDIVFSAMSIACFLGLRRVDSPDIPNDNIT